MLGSSLNVGQMIELSAGGFTLGFSVLARKCFSVPSLICWRVEVIVNVLLNGISPTWEQKEFLGPQR